MNKKPIAINMKEGRVRNGWKQQQVANKLGIGRPKYAKYEEGRAEPSLDLVRDILSLFGIKEDETYPFIYNESFWKK